MRTDWLPAPRAEILAFAKRWESLFEANRINWQIPQAKVGELTDFISDCDDALEEGITRGRLPEVNAKIASRFKDLSDFLRDLKRRYIFVPPLTEFNLVALGLKPPDTTPTPIGPPTSQVSAEISYPGKSLHRLQIVPTAGGAYDERSDYGFKIFWGYLPPGGATTEQALSDRHYLVGPPETPEQLASGNMFTRRKRDMIEHPYDTSGMTCFYCIRYENPTGGKGPWGPMFSAVIP
jgi:hypothetical protein